VSRGLIECGVRNGAQCSRGYSRELSFTRRTFGTVRKRANNTGFKNRLHPCKTVSDYAPVFRPPLRGPLTRSQSLALAVLGSCCVPRAQNSENCK